MAIRRKVGARPATDESTGTCWKGRIWSVAGIDHNGSGAGSDRRIAGLAIGTASVPDRGRSMSERFALSGTVRALVMIALTAVGARMALASGIQLYASDTSACSVEPSSKARNFLLRDIDNRKWTFSSTKGKVVLVDFWATWCGPCKVEIPEFVEMYGKYRERGLEVVGVSMDTEIDKIKSFAAEYKMSYPILIGAGAEGVLRAWDVSGLPTTFIVGRDGTVCRKFLGQASREDVEETIKKLL
jgi:peroxiredoxin